MPLDIGLGIIGAALFSLYSGIKLDYFLLLIGIFFALSPDMDFIFYLASGKKADRFSHKHRSLFHYPLLFIPIGFLVLAKFSLPYAFLFTTLSLAHFVHDSIGTGWGLEWLYPFSKKYYKFFSDETGRAAWKIQKWTPEEQNETSAKHGDDNWIKNTYLKLTLISAVEYGVLIFAIIIYLFLKR